MTTPPGHPDWQGTALVHGIDLVADRQSLVLPGNSSGVTSFPFAKPGYTISMHATIANTATNPIISAIFRWQDSVPTDYESQEWQFPATSSGNNYIVGGSGPARGQQLKLTLKNPDPAQSATVTWSIQETTERVARDDWRNANNSVAQPGVIPTWTVAPGADMPANTLMEFVGTPNGLTNYLLPLYSGQVWLAYQIVVPAANVGELFISPYNNLGIRYFDTGSINPGTVVQNAVALSLPRKPCVLQLSHSGSTTTQYAIALIAMEYGS